MDVVLSDVRQALYECQIISDEQREDMLQVVRLLLTHEQSLDELLSNHTKLAVKIGWYDSYLADLVEQREDRLEQLEADSFVEAKDEYVKEARAMDVKLPSPVVSDLIHAEAIRSPGYRQTKNELSELKRLSRFFTSLKFTVSEAKDLLREASINRRRTVDDQRAL